MSIFTTLKLAFRALWRNNVRSALTMLGIIGGIGTVIAMIAAGEGAREAVADIFRAMGTNLLIITNGSQSSFGAAGGAGSRMSLTWSDLEALENHEVPSVRWVVPVLQTKVQLAGEDTNWNTSVIGTKPDYFTIKNWEPKAGSLFDLDAATTGTKVAVIGQTVATQLYGTQNPIGQPIRINGQPFEVIGLLEPRGQSAMGQDQDDTVIVPLKAYQQKLDKGLGKFISKGQLFVSVVSEDQIDHAQDQITALLRQRHNLGAADDDDFRIRNLAQFAISQQQSTERITKLLFVVGVMSLLVGGIGVMNIMLVSVIERTREIGIRMAVGAKPTDVMMQFLVEALVLSAIGGMIGLGAGAAGAWGMAHYYGWPLLFPATMAVVAMVVSAGIGVLFGLYPAMRASQLDPITALRYET
jgi:putative ABC transport system permease protein